MVCQGRLLQILLSAGHAQNDLVNSPIINIHSFMGDRPLNAAF